MPDEYLLYLRKSVGRAGISRQRAITTAHVTALGAIIRAEHADTDRTAYQAPGAPPPERPRYREMLAALEAGPVLRLAAWDIDRVARSLEDAEELIRIAARRGGLIIETARGGTYDLSTANGRRRLRGDVVDAAYEVDHTVERVLAQQAEMRAEGRWTGGRRPFGWDVDGDSPGGLVIREAEAALVASGTAALLAGRSLGSIAREWAAATGRPWSHTLVRQVLQRPLNAALVSLRGEVIGEGAWPAIVGPAEWRACRAVLADPARRFSPGPERRHLLSGVALCGTCGLELGIDGSEARYRCRGRLARGPHDGRGLHASRLAPHLDAYATVLALGRLKRDDAHLLLRADHGDARTALLAREAAEQAEDASLWRLRKARAISDRELIEGRAEIAATLEGIRGQLAALDQADALAPLVADPDGAWGRMDVEGRRAAVAALMRVTVFPARQGRPPGTPRAGRWFDADSVDVRWTRQLPSDGA